MSEDIILKEYKSIMDASNDAIISVSLNGDVITWSRAAESIFGYSERVMLKNPLYDILPDEQVEEHKALIEEVALGKRIEKHQWLFHKSSGQDIMISESLSPLFDNDQRVIGISIVAKNNTIESENAREKELMMFLMQRMMQHEGLNTSVIDYFLNPSTDMSGDMVCAGVSSQGKYYAMLTDSTGHGLPAALNLLPMSWIFYAMIEKSLPLGVIAFEMNQRIHRISPTDRFAANIIICVDPNNLIVDVWNAGMPDVLLISNSGEIKHRFKSSTCPLGIFKYDSPPISEVVKCEKDDQIIGFSDGLTDVLNSNGETISMEKVERTIKLSQPYRRVDNLKKLAEQHTENKLAEDDVSVISVIIEEVINNFSSRK